MSKSLILAIIASLVSTLVSAKSDTQRRLKRSLVRKLHVLLSDVFPCPSDVYRDRGAHGQVCLWDLTLSSARPAPDQYARPLPRREVTTAPSPILLRSTLLRTNG
jgi:hypothetical protein